MQQIDTARELWRLLYNGTGGHLFTFTGRQSTRPEARPNELDDLVQQSWPYPDKAEAAEKYLLEQAAEGRDAYFGVHLYGSPVKGGRGRTKENSVDKVWALWSDTDGAVMPEDWPAPNIRVESSPGREHLYWLLSRAMAAEEAEKINKRIAYGMGADIGKWALGTVLRAPGTMNHKREEPTPVTARLISEDRYDPYTIAAAIPALEEVVPAQERKSTREKKSKEPRSDRRVVTTGEPPAKLRPADLEAWRGERTVAGDGGGVDRSRTLHWIGCGVARSLRHSGLSEAEQHRIVEEAVEDRDHALGYSKYTGRDDRGERYAELADEALAEAARDGGERTAHKNGGESRNGSGAAEASKSSTGHDHSAGSENSPEETPEAEEEKRERVLSARAPIADMLRGDVEPPSELLQGILLEGKIHKIFAAPGAGKSWLSLWTAVEVARSGKRVLYLDAENGTRVLAERLQALGATPELAEYLYVYCSPDMDLGAKLLELLDVIDPELLIYDSWVDFLTLAAMEENDANDVTRWVQEFASPAKDRNITTLILDHVPNESARSRGSTQKLGKVDVSWGLKKGLDFDRESVGQIELNLEKDRDGYLPDKVRFAIGGGESGFILRRDVGVEEATDPRDGLTQNHRKVLETLKESGEGGLSFTEWKRASGIAETSFNSARRVLAKKGLVKEYRNRYYYAYPEAEVYPRQGGENDPSTSDGRGGNCGGSGEESNLRGPNDESPIDKPNTATSDYLRSTSAEVIGGLSNAVTSDTPTPQRGVGVGGSETGGKESGVEDANKRVEEGGYVDGEINPHQEPPDEEPPPSDPPEPETREADIEEALDELNGSSKSSAEDAGGERQASVESSDNSGAGMTREEMDARLDRLAAEEGIEDYEPGGES